MQVQRKRMFVYNGVYLPVFLMQVQFADNGVCLLNIPDAGTEKENVC